MIREPLKRYYQLVTIFVATGRCEFSTSLTRPKATTVIDGPYLMSKFAGNSSLPIHHKVTNSEYSKIAQFLTTADVKLDWSIYKYNLIPGEGERLQVERDNLKQRSEQETFEEQLEDESVEHLQSDNAESELKPGHLKFLENQRLKLVKQDLENNLPEVILLGRCNVGKSSLINALLSKNKEASSMYARVKQTAGYTPCLNFYNVGGLFRLVDSPGYGVKGQQWQGELIIQYLSNRRVLKNCFLIFDAQVGLNQYDEMLVDNLNQLGVQFDVIFNKIDRIKAEDREEAIQSLIEDTSLADLSIKPRFFCVSSNPSPKRSELKNRTGVNEVLYTILESSGLSLSRPLVPRFKAKRINLIEQKQKYQNLNKYKRNMEKRKTR